MLIGLAGHSTARTLCFTGAVLSMVLVGCSAFNPEFAVRDADGTQGPTLPGTEGTTGNMTGSTTGSTTGDPITTSTGSSTGPESRRIAYNAAIVECTDATSNDPEACATNQGSGGVVIVANSHPSLSRPTTVFIRFDLPPELGWTVNSADLVLTAEAAGDNARSGELWEAEPFAVGSLSTAQPDAVGDSALAAEQTGIRQGDNVRFGIPVSRVALAEPTFFMIIPGSATAIGYVKSGAGIGPTLEIEYVEA